MFSHLFKYSIKKTYNLSLNIKCLKSTISGQNLSRQPSTVTGITSITNDLTKYKSNDIEKVLDLINKSSEAELLKFNISKGRVQKIGIWKRKHGNLTTIDNLLDLDGFGIKVLDSLINSIINVEPIVINTNTGRNHSYQFTVPTITNEIRAQIKTCTAIHIGVSSVTWTQLELGRSNLDQPTVLKNWHFHEIIDNKLHLIDLINNCHSIVAKIPESNVYIFESPRNAQQTSQGTPAQININTQMSQLTSIIAYAMANRAKNDQLNENYLENNNIESKLSISKSNNVLFLRQFLSARLFSTIIGNERISTSDIVRKLFEWPPRLDTGNIATEVFIDDEQKSCYRSTLGYGKEYMGQSLLMALTFIRLCLIHCPKSLTKLGLAPKN